MFLENFEQNSAIFRNDPPTVVLVLILIHRSLTLPSTPI